MRRLNLATATAVALSAITIVATGSADRAQAGGGCATGSEDFEPTGAAQCYRVPGGVTTLDITAVGGRGGNGGFVEERRRAMALARGERTGSPGGAGARVSGTVAVEPGQILWVVVGTNGQDFSGGAGFNGGGESLETGLGFALGGGGGGASDVRTVECGAADCASDADSLNSRLIVAGGGGGGGSDQDNDLYFGGAGGTPNGGAGSPEVGGGQGGTQTAGGAAAESSEPGTLGRGGDGSQFDGGGGGGLYGGGGGGSSSSGGGGGGGSSLVPAGGTSSLDATGTPSVSIVPGPTPPVARTLGPSNVKCRSALLRGRVSRGGEGVRYRFALGRVGGALVRTPFRAGPPANPVFTAVEKEGGLKRGARYRYRVIAQNPAGSDQGEFVRFRTRRSC